jgi:ABC-type transport system involved in cytochrome c biogenesis permease subunit
LQFAKVGSLAEPPAPEARRGTLASGCARIAFLSLVVSQLAGMLYLDSLDGRIWGWSSAEMANLAALLAYAAHLHSEAHSERSVWLSALTLLLGFAFTFLAAFTGLLRMGVGA